MKKIEVAALAALIALGPSCQVQKSQPSKAPIETYSVIEDTNALRSLPSQIPDHFRDYLGHDFSEKFAKYIERVESGSVISPIQTESGLPIFAEFQLPLRYSSLYDDFEHKYHLRAPKDPLTATTVVICMGGEDSATNLTAGGGNYWVLYIPSRPSMNYQLLSEGDFWQMKKQAERLYPHLAKLDTYLFGDGKGSESALLYANNYRAEFEGVAVASPSTLSGLPNLDGIALTCFTGEKNSLEATRMKKWVERLQQRGNRRAQMVHGGFQKGVTALLAQPKASSVEGVVTFTDFQYAKPFKWLTVLGKKSEQEPIRIEVKQTEGELEIIASNASSLRVIRSHELGFPQSVTKIRFQGMLYTVPKSSDSLLLGAEEHFDSWNSKTKTPPGFHHFFTSEPVYIVYLDHGKEQGYLTKCETMARTLSRMQFLGCPDFDVRLPMMGVTRYKESVLPRHRAIFIGDHLTLKEFIEIDPGYYPIQFIQGEVGVHGERIDLPFASTDLYAYGMTYPPEEEGALSLALLLSASDEEGLQKLSDHYLSATSLYRSSDLRLWGRAEGNYHFAGEYTFDCYWGKSDIPTVELSVPLQSHKVWQAFIQDILVEEGMTDAVITSKLINDILPAPTELSIAAIKNYLIDNQFVVIKLKNNKGTAALAPHLQSFMGVADIANRIARSRRLLVDAAVLDLLAPEDFAHFDYELLPYSLHEMTIKRLKKNKSAFGRSLIRVGNFIAYD